jgi:hypothetical protein
MCMICVKNSQQIFERQDKRLVRRESCSFMEEEVFSEDPPSQGKGRMLGNLASVGHARFGRLGV